MKKPLLVSELTNSSYRQNTLLSNTLAFAYYLQDLENILKSYLPETFQAHCQIAAFNYGELILRCDSAAWSNRLRFHTTQLLVQLNRHEKFYGLTRISIKTNARGPFLKIHKRPAKSQLISIENKHLLLHTAECEPDTQLAQAIKRLAMHAAPAES